MFGGGAEGIAKFDELVETGNDAVFLAEMHDGLVFIELEIAERVDEERSAAAYFFAEHADSGASVIVGFDDNVLEFFAEVLLDGRFMLFLNFGIVGKHADGAEILAAMTFVGSKKFLDGLAGVGVVVQDTGECGVASADAGEGVTRGVGFFGDRVTLLTEFGETILLGGGLLLEALDEGEGVLPFLRSPFGIVADANGRFEEFGFARSEFPLRLLLMDQGLLSLLLFAVEAQDTLAGLRCGAT